MSEQERDATAAPPTLRLWPGVVAVALQFFCRFIVPLFAPDALEFSVISGLVGGLIVLIWWAFFSRAALAERWGAIALIAVAFFLTSQIIHESMATGMMGLLLAVYATPILSLALVAGAAASQYLPTRPRIFVLGAAILLACAIWPLLRTDGLTGGAGSDFAWRWSQTPEQELLARANDEALEQKTNLTATHIKTAWPGFRGPRRDGIIRSTKIAADWQVSPPVELWRRAVGPGWSSFAVGGDLVYTQEQRGEDEMVSCYNARTGEPVWRHGDAARFWESNAGAGPRATPTLDNGRLYTLGATGILNALDAADGTVIWSRNAATDTGTEIPGWGFAASPLVVDDLVIAATAGALAAYDRNSGEPRWFAPQGGYGYSSPHRITLDGVEQILLLRGNEAIGIAPSDGKLLWQHALPPGSSIVQPALTADGDLLISDGEKTGMRRVTVARQDGTWATDERWSTNGLKPYFSDFVVHEGHAYGFDGSILACIDVETGKRQWKGGRYGQGQLVLLADQDLLLVLSERGELALVAAIPDHYAEQARFAAVSGKTWNHPALVGDILYVRNDREMVAFRLPLLGH